jgi:hypothetical protein
MEGLMFHGSRWAFYTPVGCTPEVYVRPFPAAAGIWIATAGGTQPHWRADGKELGRTRPPAFMPCPPTRLPHSTGVQPSSNEGPGQFFAGQIQMLPAILYQRVETAGRKYFFTR